MASQTWSPASSEKFRVGAPTQTLPATQLHNVPTPAEGAARAASPLSPQNPLFWFGAAAAVTFGLMAFSTTVRVGGKDFSVSAGKT